ncbi:two-component system, sensor histidine kinase YcbA [Laceyella tengchongensis]|uniref:histidine kinase n=2 Tax=Laceyella TaxID=292635 RepID=A0AA46AGY4_9BACL|nr:sensor histidine kinase [Laceyella tengchongensis]SMP32906.1 two-component system, sensor histidine kinase YcbA [Laceyella tengchongensis]
MQRRMDWLWLIAVVLAVPLAGEYNVHPFQDDYRVSMSIPIYFFAILWIRQYSPLTIGLAVSIAVVAWRSGLHAWFYGGVDLDVFISDYLPSFSYYLTYAALLHWVRVRDYHDQPFVILLIGFGTEVMSGMVELMLRKQFGPAEFELRRFTYLWIIAMIRNLTVIGVYAMIIFKRERQEKQQKLMMLAGLYEEAHYMDKLLDQAKQVSHDVKQVQQLLQEGSTDRDEMIQQLRQICVRCHEIHKHLEVIDVGLSRLMKREHAPDEVNVHELLEIVFLAGRNYAERKGRRIEFMRHVYGEHPLYPTNMMLSILTNLVSNAVEAIERSGVIKITAIYDKDWVHFQVWDNGPGIRQPVERVFVEGYTTKWDEQGKQSTGIGLFHVKGLVEEAGGEVKVWSDQQKRETEFTVSLPLPLRRPERKEENHAHLHCG